MNFDVYPDKLRITKKITLPNTGHILPKSQIDDFSRYETNMTAFFAMSKSVVNSSYLQLSTKNWDWKYFRIFGSPVFL
jgi:hypothetical protein